MNKITKEILKVWQKSDALAENNPSFLLEGHALETEFSIAVMDMYVIAEKMLYNLPVDNISYPKELTRHLKANADQACMACRCSSLTGNNHPECNEKITEWFESKSELLMYVELILE